MAVVLKTTVLARVPGVQILPSPMCTDLYGGVPKHGLRGRFAKPLVGATPARVRISPPPLIFGVVGGVFLMIV